MTELANFEETLKKAAEAIKSAKSLVFAGHVNPDGDALGSALALYHLCKANGVDATITWPNPLVAGDEYRFLPGLNEAVPSSEIEVPDVMVTCDCGSIKRLQELAPIAEKARELIVIDHHVTNANYGTINLTDRDAAATAVVVRRLIDALGWKLNRDAAMCIYTGLVTDTGRFQYSSTTAEIFDLAAELVRFDLPVAEMSRVLFEENRFAYLQLVSRCLARAELDEGLEFIATWITKDDLKELGVDLNETEGMIDMIRKSREAEVSCVLKEADEGIRVSLRAISRIDVSKIAEEFGGGGHRFAAGFVSHKSIDDTIQAIKKALVAQAA